MPRQMPPDRFAAVVAASAQVFVAHGFQRAQVQDVADVLGVSKGALYGYANGKLALFSAALRYADGVEPLPDRSMLPVAPALPGDLAGVVRDRLAAQIPQLELTQALLRDAPPEGVTGPQELAAVVADLYRRLSANRFAIKLVDRCAPEFSELRQVWFEDGRSLQMGAMAEYLRRRGDSGHLAVPGVVELVARTMVELCVLWGVHRHWDPAGTPAGLPAGQNDFDDDEVVDMLTGLLVHGTTPAAAVPPAGMAAAPTRPTRPTRRGRS
jgi:AcrR family transcriptional regulator